MSQEYFLFTDGACRGNPGESGAGAVLYDKDMNEISNRYLYLGTGTNNEAEYNAILLGIEMCKEKCIDTSKVNLRADSMLAMNHLNGVWKCRHPNLVPLFDRVKKLSSFLSVKHVYRDKNKRADQLANMAIDNKL